MKNVLLGLIALSSISAFAQSITVVGGLELEGQTYVQKTCESKVYEEVMSSQTVKAKLQVLLADAQENLEKIAAISTKAQEIAAEVCN